MTFVSDDRWTCPVCGVTVSFPGPVRVHRSELIRVQTDHGRAHPRARPRRRGLIIQFPSHDEMKRAS